MVDKEYCIRKTLNIVNKIKLSKDERKATESTQKQLIKNRAAEKLTYDLVKVFGKDKYKKAESLSKDFVEDPYNKKYWVESRGIKEGQYKDILKRYLDIMYKVTPATGIDANNNEIFDISYAILTSEQNVAKALKPGGFDEHKLIAYVNAAFRVPEVRSKYTYDELLATGTKAVGKLIEEENKNLIYLDTQLEYYEHNNSASSLLGISAVNSVAHAILVDDNIGIDLTDVGELPSIGGFNFSSKMRLDPSVAQDGAPIAETLGSCVAASADAAKDPVMNLLNLNPKTFNVYTTLIRLGMPNSMASLLMSSKVLSDAIIQSNAESLNGEWSTPESALRDFLNSKEVKALGYSAKSSVYIEPITRDNLIDALHSGDINLKIKIASALIKLFRVSEKVRLADQVTRFNSISSAVGPSTLDNYVFTQSLESLDSESSHINKTTFRIQRF